MQRIVVGIDGSNASRQAARWAVDEASQRHGQVQAIHAWTIPHVGPTGLEHMLLDVHDLETHARRELDTVIDSTDTTNLESPIDRVVVCEHPAKALLDAAKEADLLVVGARGLGTFAGAEVGSVSQHVVRHAPCPVVVVRSEDM